MGWTEEDMRFSSDRAKPWNNLVNAYRPLTDKGTHTDTPHNLKANLRF